MAIGPFAIMLPRLFLLFGLAGAVLAAHLWERRGGMRLDKPLWWSVIITLIGARLGYVLTHLADFRVEPLTAFYFWQSGYAPVSGILALAVTVAVFAYARRYPIKALLTPALTGLFIWGGLSWVSYALHQATDISLPDMVLEDLVGDEVSLADFQGQPVVVNLWATWCPPCRREMPVLAEAQAAYPDMHFVFPNQAEGPGTIRQFLLAEQLQLNNILLDLGGATGRHFNAPGLPTTLFFNAEGRLIDSHLGELSRASLGDYLRKLDSQEQR